MHADALARFGHNKLRPLALSLSLAAIATSSTINAWAHSPFADPYATPISNEKPHHPAAPKTWLVQNCSDAAPGSLRDIIENPANAQSGDTVDLGQLPVLCANVDSLITLTTGEIQIAQDDLTITGPGNAGPGSATISANDASRIFNHTGAGSLGIERLNLVHGYYHAVGDANGGCVVQAANGGDLYFLDSSISGCVVSGDSGTVRGGGISNSLGYVTLVRTIVSDDEAHTVTGIADGGGIYARYLATAYSSISGNVAGTGTWGEGRGGGVHVGSTANIFNSTLDGNHASYGGGVFARGVTSVVNSTLSDNTADTVCAAMYATSPLLMIWGSTIADNRARQASPFGAVMFLGPANGVVDLESSILANGSGSNSDATDLYIAGGSGVLSGADNLVMSSNMPPTAVITLTADPMLGPLRANGGVTRTRIPMSGSPVREAGNNPGSPNEQRGRNYPRSRGGKTDIGATQFDAIFYGGPD